MKRSLALPVLILTLAIGVVAIAAETKPASAEKVGDHGLFTPGDVKWLEGPPSLPSGAKLAVLEGDPGKEGPFTIRLKVPDGYKIPPHWHSKTEHVTVISGTFNLAFGETFVTLGGHAMPAGTFGFMPPGMRHFAWAKGDTVIQLHGVGPWDINYVSPADDPRKK